jgi:hypothetical protein
MLLLIAAALAGLAAAAGPAQAALVPGELRFGPTDADPLVPLLDPPAPETRLGVRELPGGAPAIDLDHGGDVLTCDPQPAGQVTSVAGLSSNPPVAGSVYLKSPSCHSVAVDADRIELTVAGDPFQSFAMRAETNRRGGRDGVLEPQPGRPFRVTLDFFHTGEAEPYDGCVLSIFKPGSPTRIDVYNPGHGHKIDFDEEPLTYVSGNGVCSTAPLYLNAEVRLRGYDAAAAGGPWVKPVWLLPAAAGAR